MNLVEGGARRGVFQTRHARLVRIVRPFEFSEPPQPGMEPVARVCWEGELYQADGKTVDTNGVWESSGAFQVQNGVIQRNDLVMVVSIDSEPAPALIEKSDESQPKVPVEQPSELSSELQQEIEALKRHIAEQDRLISQLTTFTELTTTDAAGSLSEADFQDINQPPTLGAGTGETGPSREAGNDMKSQPAPAAVQK